MQTVLIKRSSTAGKVPDALQAGELAVNLIDQKLFTADVDGNVFELGGTKVDSGGDPPATGENTGDLYWNGTNLLVWDGAAWEIVGPVVSVNGKDGTVVLDADDVGAATAGAPPCALRRYREQLESKSPGTRKRLRRNPAL